MSTLDTASTANSESIESSDSTGGVAARLLSALAANPTLPGLLEAVCAVAVNVVPDCASAGVCVIREGAPATVAASDERAARLDETQGFGDGLCRQAARTGRQLRLEDLSAEDLSVPPGDAVDPWLRAARQLGVTAVLSLPVPAGDDIAVGLTLYADRARGWSEAGVRTAEEVARHAGQAVAVAGRLTGPPEFRPVVRQRRDAGRRVR